ncbi:MAG: hypothetical protein LQ344_005744 [Seirophora lacunosa]|nr:MAG: hypothetical protein LQ344_005744 [Seirophora lacunosa]
MSAAVSLLSTYAEKVNLNPSFDENGYKRALQDTSWADGLRGIAAVFVMFSHLVMAFARWIVIPCHGKNGPALLMQRPIFRLVGQGASWVAVFIILSGFVNALKPVKYARAGSTEPALANLAVSSFRRSFRLVLPATAATIISWFITQFGAYETAKNSDAYWLYKHSPSPSSTWVSAVDDLLHAIRTTWTYNPDNPYDQPQWALEYPLRLARYSPLFALPLLVVGLVFMSFPSQFQEWAPWSDKLLQWYWKIAPANAELSRFWPTIGAQVLTFSIVMSPHLRRALSHRWFLWLGKISFPLYLLHGSFMRSVLAWLLFSRQQITEIEEEGQKHMRYPLPGVATFMVVMPIFFVILFTATHFWAIKIEPYFGIITKTAEEIMFGKSENKGLLVAEQVEQHSDPHNRAMEHSGKPSSTSLFQVYLRLRPPPSPLVQLTPQSLYPSLPPPERYLTVEPPVHDSRDGMPTHITIRPPSDSRKRAVEKFAFTKVFQEEAAQLEVFRGTGIIPLVEGVLGEGRDGLLATLGVTGSGKSHTILGSKSQRGLTQLSLDLIYRSLSQQTLRPNTSPPLIASLSVADASEAQIVPARDFLEGVYGDSLHERANSRAPTPMTVGRESHWNPIPSQVSGPKSQWAILSLSPGCSVHGQRKELSSVSHAFEEPMQNAEPKSIEAQHTPSKLPFWNVPRVTRKQAKLRFGNTLQDPNFVPNVPKRHLPQRPSALPQFPDITDVSVSSDASAEYAILVSMYEVYNDRIFDLLSHPRNLKDLRRRPLLFKPTESSPDRKVVAGLRKVVCGSYEEALMVLETGLMERRVAGTGSNSSERARNAKTAGATLAEAGKINESLMYLGQCLQMQSDYQESSKCKLTELLFSNSFPSSHHPTTHNTHHHRNAQKAIMIVTADPLGDFNATSQILRYSALAREVTVPRIPSVSSTMLAGPIACSGTHRADGTGQTSPVPTHTDEAVVEMAFSEIARLGEEVEILQVKLNEEEGRRREAEEAWQKAEDRAEDVERAVREECWDEMEQKMAEERRRWMGAWGDEADRNDEHLDRKLDILTKGIHIYEDPLDNDERVVELEAENERLRRQLDSLEREINARSPTRPSRKAPQLATPRKQVGDSGDDFGTTLFKLSAMNLSPKEPKTSPMGKTPGKKIRKLTTRKWDLMDENEMDAYDGL